MVFDNLLVWLFYMFVIIWFVYYLKVMVCNKIGLIKEVVQFQCWLNDWIMDYVDGDLDNFIEEIKVCKFLCEVKVIIIDDEENLGYYWV